MRDTSSVVDTLRRGASTVFGEYRLRSESCTRRRGHRKHAEINGVTAVDRAYRRHGFGTRRTGDAILEGRACTASARGVHGDCLQPAKRTKGPGLHASVDNTVVTYTCTASCSTKTSHANAQTEPLSRIWHKRAPQNTDIQHQGQWHTSGYMTKCYHKITDLNVVFQTRLPCTVTCKKDYSH